MTTTTKPLFNLSVDWLALTTALEDAGGELTEETEAQFTVLAEALADKVDAYGGLVKTLELQSIGLDDRIKALQQAKKSRENLIVRLKDRLLNAMLLMGQRKLEGDFYAARIGESKATVVDHEGDVPPEFWKVPEPVLDRAGLKRTLESGTSVPGARLEIRPYVVIR